MECEEQLAGFVRDESAAQERFAAGLAETDAAKVAAKAVGDEARVLNQGEAPLVVSLANTDIVYADSLSHGAKATHRKSVLAVVPLFASVRRHCEGDY